MKKDIKMLTEVLDIIQKKRKQINFDSNAARQEIAAEVVHQLRKRKCQINKIELWARKRQINTYFMATPMSAESLLERGYCCGLKCKNCPYFPRHITGNKTIVNEKTPNKHFFNSSRSFTYDDQKNDWQELSDNFYFLEGDDAEICYFNAEDGKNFIYDPNEWQFNRC